jgi:Abnormal spindle-like microcephaly-assoc'd, ASPM-SPD-2-Hydin
VGLPRRKHARLRRIRALPALIAVAVNLPAALTPAPVAATSGISVAPITADSQWTETIGGSEVVHMVGKIQNLTGGDVAFVEVNLNWLDSGGNVVGHSSSVASKKYLKNSDYSPFEDIEIPAAGLGYDHFAVASTSYSVSIPKPYGLSAGPAPCPVGAPSDEVCGVVTNNGSLTVDNVSAILTYTAGSTAVGQDVWPVDNDLGGTAFASGDQGHFQFLRSDGHSPVTIAYDAEPAYLVGVDPGSLDVGIVNLGSSGQATVLLTNNGGNQLTVSSVQANPAPEFGATSDCPAPGLAPGYACHVTVRFTPTANGPQSGTLTVVDNAAGNPLTIPLTATRTAPAVSFTPSSQLDFGSTLRAGMPGLTLPVTLRNTGNGVLTINSVTTDDPADFSADASACPSAPKSLPPGGQCPISVTFAPPIAGPYLADLLVSDNAGMQLVPLTAIARGPGAQFRLGGTPISNLNFGTGLENSTGPPLTVNLFNNGTETLVVTAIAMSDAQFRQTNTCGPLPATILPNSGCAFIITFTAANVGQQSGTLTVADNAATLQQSLVLNGIGARSPSPNRRLSNGIRRGQLHDATIVIRRRPW